jgi:hypothetical protein
MIFGDKNRTKQEISQVKKRKVYRVIAGNITNPKELELLKKQLKKKFPDCFVVEFK